MFLAVFVAIVDCIVFVVSWLAVVLAYGTGSRPCVSTGLVEKRDYAQ